MDASHLYDHILKRRIDRAISTRPAEAAAHGHCRPPPDAGLAAMDPIDGEPTDVQATIETCAVFPRDTHPKAVHRCATRPRLLLGLGFAMGFHAAGGPPGGIAAVALVLVFALALSWAWTAFRPHPAQGAASAAEVVRVVAAAAVLTGIFAPLTTRLYIRKT